MALSNGTNLGLMVNGAEGEEHYADLMKQWRGLDALVMPHVQSRTLATPPSSIVDGQYYIIPAGATGVWAGRTNRIARGFTVGTGAPGWEYYVPKKGWSVMVEDEGDMNGVPLEYRYDGTNWVKPDLGPTREEVLLNPMTTVGDIIIAGADGSPIRLPAGGNKQVLTSEDGVPKWLDPEVSGGGGGGGMTNPMAAQGDLIVGGASGAAQRLGVGTAGQVLKVVDGNPQWANESGGGGGGDMTNPMTTAGDIIVADEGGVPMRLGKGADNQVLKMVAGLLAWANEVVGMINPMTTPSDLIVGGVDGAPTRLPKGADNQVLKIIAGALQWAEDSGGMTNPMSTAGDIIVGGTSGAPTRLAKGTDGQVLKMVAGALAWAAESGGGGGPASTDELAEGATNKYFTAARVLASVLTGYAAGTNTALAATDTVLQALQKLQGQVTARLPLAGGQMTGAVLQAPAVSVASAATTNIAVTTAETINITGTTTITAFSTAAAGIRKRLIFGGALTLTHGPSSLILPGYANITTAAGDVAEMESLGSGNWKCVSYTKVNGRQVALGAAVPTLTAANETNIYAPGVDVVKVSGTTGIGYLGSGADGQEVTVIFTAATPLYHSASLVLPSSMNLTTAAGDITKFVYEGAGVTRLAGYMRADGRPITGGVTPGYIEGLQLSWNSATSVSVAAGAAYIPSLGRVVSASSALTLSGLSLTASTLYHLYLYENSGVPALECVTTAPSAPYFGTARTKTGDTSRRYVGSILTNSSSEVVNFQHAGSQVFYRINPVAQLRVVSSQAVTAWSSMSFAAVVPVAGRQAIVQLSNTSSSGGVLRVQAGDGTYDDASNDRMYGLLAGATVTGMLPLSSTLTARYQTTTADTMAVDVQGYILER